MPSLVLQSFLLLCGTFAVFAGLGWLLAGKRRRNRPERAYEAVDWSVPETVTEAPPARPRPVEYLDAAAEHFTAGVVVHPKTPEPDRAPYMPFNPVTQKAVAQESYLRQIDDFGAVRRVSSLAGMTPESVEAAVQQAGSGLEPVRLNAPQGPVDDLTVISGITADQQKQLNNLGIYHFWQIAGWTPEHVAWVANRLPTSRRIARENWMSQAAKLARLH
jgi:predicted flap endonuclease-1-like 5' DNA nuclease